MEKAVLIAINEYSGASFCNLEAVHRTYSKREILDIYLNYEGIIGYTDKILRAMKAIGFSVDETPAAVPAPVKISDPAATLAYLKEGLDRAATQGLPLPCLVRHRLQAVVVIFAFWLMVWQLETRSCLVVQRKFYLIP